VRNLRGGRCSFHGVALLYREGDFCQYAQRMPSGPRGRVGSFRWPPVLALVDDKAPNRLHPDIKLDKRIPYDLYEGTFVGSL
jgi:hypothetical protein